MKTNIFLSAFLHILYQIVFILFIFPYDLWCGAVKRLSNQREAKSLKVSEIKSPWPLFTFFKRWFIDFLFDALTAIIWIIGLIYFFKHFPFHYFKFSHFIVGLYTVYFLVVPIGLARDAFILILKPFVKFLSWLNKPAQHLDITIDKELPRS